MSTPNETEFSNSGLSHNNGMPAFITPYYCTGIRSD